MKVKSLIVVFLAGMWTTCSWAGQNVEGTYSCKNRVEGLPNDTYVIRNLAVEGERLPFVEAKRFYRSEQGKDDSPVSEARIAGFATISETKDSLVLMVGAARLEFIGGRLLGCAR